MRALKLFIFIFSIFSISASAQDADQISISAGTANTCNGVLFDSGGMGGSGYSNNENHTLTICPDTPGDVISLVFTVFNLDQTGSENSWDRLAIWDGESTSAATLGVYTGAELNNVIVSGTNLNVSGCLTLQFTSNSGGTGQFAAQITCDTPCNRPTVAATDNGPINRKICVGEEITFDGTGSFAAPGFNIASYTWEFGDGFEDTSGPVVTHTFTEPGEYITQLFVLDDNGCINSNLIDLQFLVSTYPTFDPFPGDTILCLGETLTLEATPNDYELQWIGNTGELTGEEFCNEDAVGVLYSSEQQQSGFGAGQTITSVDDIQSICVNMEHSFMGDIILQVECPTGETVMLHQQGGGGTQLGEPIDSWGGDDNGACEDPGVGYTYCWTADATETWVEASGGTLPEGDYEPVGDLSDLIGCPLNGVWSFLWTDNWGIDDGNLFTWGINFAPEFYPDVTEFTPDIGEGADSSAWLASPIITNISEDGNTAEISYNQTGDYNITYGMVNDHGCEFDSTLTVTFKDPPQAEAGPDVAICADPVQLMGGLAEGSDYYPPSQLQYTWEPPFGLSNPNIKNPTAFVQSNTTYTLYVNEVGRPLCGTTDQVTVTVDPLADPGLNNDTLICFNIPPFQLRDALLGNPVAGGVWTDANGNVVPDIFTPTDHVDGGVFNYTYTVTNGACVGVSNLDISVLPSTDLTCCQTNSVPGEDAVACALSYQLQAEYPIGVGTWTVPEGVTISDIHDPHATISAVSPGGIFTLTWTDSNGYACSASNDIVVVLSDPLQLDMVTIDANCADSCDGQAIVVPYGGITENDYTFDWSSGEMFQIPQNRKGLCQGPHSVTVSDDFGCIDSLSFQIAEPEPQVLTTTFTIPSCVGDCDGKIVAESEGAIEYSFNGGESYSSSNEGFVCAGSYSVVARNEKGCIVSDSVSVNDPVPFVADVNVNPNPTTVKNTLISFQNISSPGPIAETHWIFGTNTTEPVGESMHRDTTFRFPSDTSGVYDIFMETSNNFGCVDTFSVRLIINDDLQWYIPNSFTPNGDGINDNWKPVGNAMNISEYDLKIFDRWGNLVFETTDYEEFWNGSSPANDEYYAGTSIFPFVLTVTSATTEERHTINGFLTVIR